MANRTSEKRGLGLGHQQWVALVAIGAGIGWLIGHSVSPVLASVITSLLGMVAGIVAGLRSVWQRNPDGEAVLGTGVDARPVAILVLGIALAATGAMFVKAHRLLEPKVVREAAWRAASEGRLAELAVVDPHSALLFKLSQSECNQLLSLKDNDKAFASALEHSSSRGARQLTARIKDPRTLVTVVEALCDRD